MRAALLVLFLAVLIAGCGYKAPLYLPKPKPVAQKPAAPAASSPPAATQAPATPAQPATTGQEDSTKQ